MAIAGANVVETPVATDGGFFLSEPALSPAVDLAGKVALVTGASRGIGAECAKHLASRGMKVVLCARSMGALEAVVAEITAAGGTASAFHLDATVEVDHAAAFAFAKETYGPVYAAYANAGVAPVDIVMKQAEDLTLTEIQQVLVVNQMHATMVFVEAFKHFKENGGGVWLVTSSIAAGMPGPLYGMFPTAYHLYSNSKSAVADMNRVFAAGYAKDNIRCYCIAPGAYTTKLLTDAIDAGIVPGATTPDELAGLNPLNPGTSGDPADIGPVVAACIDGSTLYPSGAAIVTDGDVTMPLNELTKRNECILNLAEGHPIYDIDFDNVKDCAGRPLADSKLKSLTGYIAKHSSN